jgi:N-acetylglucosaminyldiphosphoundecaprenol N-acetyl-beta-D-mannosaminyltransferase
MNSTEPQNLITQPSPHLERGTEGVRSSPRRILVVQLADIGDLVLSTPALRRLRMDYEEAHIAVLTTKHAAPIIQSGLLHLTPKRVGVVVNEVITFDKHTFDSPKALLKPANLRKALALGAQLRRGRYDTVLIFHHFSTRFGSLKFAALAWAAGAKRVIGLDNGNGFFLTERLPDEGFGVRHQAQYWLALVAQLSQGGDQTDEACLVPTVGNVGVGTRHASSAPVEYLLSSPYAAQIGMRAEAFQRAQDLLMPLDRTRPIIAIHAGSGGYSLARRWEPEKFAAVADALAERHNAQIVLVGGAGDDTAAVKAAMRSPVLDVTGKTTLGQLAALLEDCSLFIGADSGVMHIAAAANTPVVAIFGPSNANAWSPWATDGFATVVRSAPACSPCSYVGTEVGLRNGCAARTCMRMVTAEQVIAAAETRLAQPRKSRYVATPVRIADPAAHQFRSEQRVHLLGLPVDNIAYDDWLRLIGEWIAEAGQPRARQVCTINPEFMMMAQRDINFRNILRRAALCVPDGAGLLWAARRHGTPLRQRVTGSDGVPIIAAAAAEPGWRLYFLGAAEGVAEKAAEVLRARHPALKIVGTYSGSPAPEDEDALVERVNASGADLLFVAFGAPEQDKWIARNLPRLNVRMAMGVGGTFDFIAGVVPRAPVWMQRLGLEWLFRLALQPWRIRRMLRLPQFVWRIVTSNENK